MASPLVDLGPHARVALAAAWIAGQIVLVATGGMRPGATFGFRMFSESTTLSASLSRVVEAPTGHGTTIVPITGGAWNARDRDGTMRRFKWRDRVHNSSLSTFDKTMHASYGDSAQRARWQAALDDVAAHLSEDAETRQLLLDLTIRKNGHEPVVIHLESAARAP